MADDWTRLMGRERLAVDETFSRRIADSRFSRSEWGMVMTVVDFEIEAPDDPDRAELVADTSRVRGILPELRRVRNQPVVGPAGGSPGTGTGGGLLETIKSVLGITGRDDTAVVQAADQLAQTYASELQAELEASGRWGEVCAKAADAE